MKGNEVTWIQPDITPENADRLRAIMRAAVNGRTRYRYSVALAAAHLAAVESGLGFQPMKAIKSIAAEIADEE